MNSKELSAKQVSLIRRRKKEYERLFTANVREFQHYKAQSQKQSFLAEMKKNALEEFKSIMGETMANEHVRDFDEIESRAGATSEITIEEDFEFPDYSFLIEGLGICPGAPTLLCAKGASGKTLLVQYIAACVATGRALFDRFPVRQGKVVHIDYEQTKIETKVRYARIVNGMNCSLHGVEYISPTWKLTDLDAEDRIRELAEGRSLIVIDSYRGAIEGDENDSSARIALDMLGRVSDDTKCTMLVIVHSGKGPQRVGQDSARGTSALFDAAGTFFNLEPSPTAAETFQLTRVKCRARHVQFAFAYRLNDLGDFIPKIGKHRSLTFSFLHEVDPQKKRAKLSAKFYDALKEKSLSASELQKTIGGSTAAYNSMRNCLVEEGLIEVVEAGRNRTYQLTEKGKDESVWEELTE